MDPRFFKPAATPKNPAAPATPKAALPPQDTALVASPPNPNIYGQPKG